MLDASGGVVPEATVYLQPEWGVDPLQQDADAQGEYLFFRVTCGEYQVWAVSPDSRVSQSLPITIPCDGLAQTHNPEVLEASKCHLPFRNTSLGAVAVCN